MATRHPSNPEIHPDHCTNEQRISRLEVKTDAHEAALTDGKIEFASIKKDLAAIMLSQSEIKLALARPQPEPTRLDKFWDSCVNWLAGCLLLALLWAIAKSGQIPGVAP